MAEYKLLDEMFYKNGPERTFYNIDLVRLN